jgi:hypothetical protein
MPQPDEPREAQAAPDTPTGSRRPYRRPELTEYGSVAKLTQGTLTVNSDAMSGMMMMACL